MRFYTKIFIAFLGLLTITSHVAVGGLITIPDHIYSPIIGISVPIDDYNTDNLANGTHYPCGKVNGVPIQNQYIAKCDLYWPSGEQDDESTEDVDESKIAFPGVDLTPEGIFSFAAAATGYLCWDFDDPKKNYENLRILFGNDTSAKLECYGGQPGSIEEKLYIIRANQKPITQKIAFPYHPAGDTGGYNAVAFAFQIACSEKSIETQKEIYCQPCPHSGISRTPEFDVRTRVVYPYLSVIRWQSFPTIADCYYWDDADRKWHEDNTGWFEYGLKTDTGATSLPDNGTCYYSGE